LDHFNGLYDIGTPSYYVSEHGKPNKVEKKYLKFQQPTYGPAQIALFK